jgi:predicted ATP-dependent endonuclease of OLD family
MGQRLHSLVLIDEAENHLHPAIQAQLRELLVNQFHSQVFVITHSAIFVNTRTLSSTIRFFLDSTGTRHKKCKDALHGNAKSIVNVLNYSNGARIFFTTKVVIVEGPSDQDFITAVIRHNYPNEDIEVLAAGDKYQVMKWKTIIERLGVKVCTIRDLDAAKKGSIKTIRDVKKDRSLRRSDVAPEERELLTANMNNAAREHDYILARGAIEEYIPGGVSNYSNKTAHMRAFLDGSYWNKEYLGRREITHILNEIVKY